MEEKKKSNKGLIIIIIILVIALLATSGYIIYDKVIKKEEVTEENKTQEEEQEQQPVTRNITEEEQTILLDQMTAYTTYFADSYPITEETPLDNWEALTFATTQLQTTFSDFMESDLEKVLEQYFGKNHPYIHEDINCFAGDGVLYKYDSAKRTYTYQDMHAHGGRTTFRPNGYILEGTVEDDTTYEVTTQILYANNAGDTTGPRERYYITANRNPTAEEYEDCILGPYGVEHEVTEEEYQSIKDQIPITTFTFEKDEDNNYGLKSVTIA